MIQRQRGEGGRLYTDSRAELPKAAAARVDKSSASDEVERTEGALKTQTKNVCVTDIDEDTVAQNIPADETLNVLSLQRRFNDCSLEKDVVRKNEPDRIFVAGNVVGGRRMDVCNPDRT